jgi:FkbM family methyltransferase
MRRPLKIECFNKIKSLGIPIDTVIDVGILTGTGELMTAFQDKKHFLVEPIVEWNDKINFSYTKAGIDYTLVNVAASNFDGSMSMETSSVLPGQPISHARLTDKAASNNIRTVPVRTIDSLMVEYALPSPFLIKLDVDGVELQILEGAKSTLGRANVVVVEAGLRNYFPRSSFLESNGFELFDIVDLCYYDDRLRQFDMVFINSRIVIEQNLDMQKHPFDINKWIVFN